MKTGKVTKASMYWMYKAVIQRLSFVS